MTSWTARAELGNAVLIRFMAWLAIAAGRTFCRMLLYPIVGYYFVTDRTARQASREFLQAATNRPPKWRDVFAHLYAFAATLLDRVYLAAGQFHRFRISVAGDALLREAVESGCGCVLLGSHLGSFDLMRLANDAFKGLPISMMMHFDARSRFRRIIGIPDDPRTVIHLGRPDSFISAYERLERGEMVAVLADRVNGKGASLETVFLGKPAAFPLGPHVLAARAGVPVLMCFGLYEGGARYRIEFAEFGAAAPPDSSRAKLQDAVDRYASLLEQAARRYPHNWFNFYPYWSR